MGMADAWELIRPARPQDPRGMVIRLQYGKRKRLRRQENRAPRHIAKAGGLRRRIQNQLAFIPIEVKPPALPRLLLVLSGALFVGNLMPGCAAKEEAKPCQL